MRWSPWAGVACAHALVTPAMLLAASPLTLPLLHDHVRARASAVLVAQTALAEARGARAGATPLFAQNPSITGGAGATAQPSGWQPRAWDGGGAAMLSMAVPVELGGQRWARMAAADGHIRVEEFRVQAALLGALHQATEAFQRALHAQELARVAEDAVVLAQAFRVAAEQMRAAGLGSSLDLELARMEEEDAMRSAAAQRAVAARARAELTTQLGVHVVPGGLAGTLRSQDALPSLEDALARVEARPDLRALAAEGHAAARDAAAAVAEAAPVPTLGASYQYQHQSPAPQHVVLGQVTFPLPVFARNQGDETRARARARGVALEREQALESARAQVRAAHALLRDTRAARRELDAAGGDRADITQRLQRAYREGTADLGTVLNVQRRLVAARRASLDLDLQEALARTWLDSASGVMP